MGIKRRLKRITKRMGGMELVSRYGAILSIIILIYTFW